MRMVVRISSTLFALPQSTAVYARLLSARRLAKVFALAAVVYTLLRLLDYGLLLCGRKYCLSRQDVDGFYGKSALRSLLHTYQIHARSAEEERRLGERPLRWIDIELTRRSSDALGAYCRDSSTTNESAILVVHSRAENAEARQYFRQQLHLEQHHYFRPIFVVSTAGLDVQSALSTRIRAEIDRYGDVMELENVEESYRNMTHKVRAWVDHLSRCRSASSTAKFIVKVDEDVNVDFAALRTLLDARFADRSRVVLCRTYSNGQITRNPHSKWYLSAAEYAAPSLGLYCQGMAYAFSVDLLPAMRANLRRVQFLWMDDWYATHALMNRTNAMYVDVGPHVISADGPTEVAELLGGTAEKWRKRFARFPPIFGHFRPASSYPPTASRELWRRIKSRFGKSTCSCLFQIFRR